MKSDREREFEQNMKQLVQLLKKIIISQPSQEKTQGPGSLTNEKGLNINLCFFTFLPINAEELDELEEIYEQFLFDEDKKVEDLTTDLNSSDEEFLRRNGIRF